MSIARLTPEVQQIQQRVPLIDTYTDATATLLRARPVDQHATLTNASRSPTSKKVDEPLLAREPDTSTTMLHLTYGMKPKETINFRKVLSTASSAEDYVLCSEALGGLHDFLCLVVAGRGVVTG
ncbi:hypothetical protein VE01_04956 [Pseudogymnoascus verrucosus]|uniref:Uncharacterized protein n=1 Tax=Pseudogymnoascus verrucosus TaxID=342668 RepID=A0A1B8GPG5_9PEZI|nr:uncharacterized protein VE01_04956 [Pseudogymnoascus verrucosus]OBT97702.1 hypothetical protein VE01_04956 [Pseudogymnoascus verrucosus]